MTLRGGSRCPMLHQCIVRPRLCCSCQWFTNGRTWCPFARSAGSGMIRVDWNYRHGFLPKSVLITPIFRDSFDILRGWGGPANPTTTSGNWLEDMTGEHLSAYLRICVTKKSQKIQEIIIRHHLKTVSSIWKKRFLRVLMRICVSVYFLKKS